MARNGHGEAQIYEQGVERRLGERRTTWYDHCRHITRVGEDASPLILLTGTLDSQQSVDRYGAGGSGGNAKAALQEGG